MKVLLAVSVVIMVVFGAMLVILKITGTDGGNGIVATPTASRLPPSTTPRAGPTDVIPTPLYLTPTPAAQGGRPDCPREWYVYRDPDGHFSVCYPVNWEAVTVPPDADLGTAVTLMSDGYAELTLYWQPSSYFQSPDDDRCHIAPSWEGAEQVTVEVAGKSAVACTGYETLRSQDAPPLHTTFAEIALDSGKGYVVFFLTRPEGADYSAEADTAAAVLASLTLG